MELGLKLLYTLSLEAPPPLPTILSASKRQDSKLRDWFSISWRVRCLWSARTKRILVFVSLTWVAAVAISFISSMAVLPIPQSFQWVDLILLMTSPLV